MLHLTVEQARGFYAEHEGRPFFDGLVEFLSLIHILKDRAACQQASYTSQPGKAR